MTIILIDKHIHMSPSNNIIICDWIKDNRLTFLPWTEQSILNCCNHIHNQRNNQKYIFSPNNNNKSDVMLQYLYAFCFSTWVTNDNALAHYHYLYSHINNSILNILISVRFMTNSTFFICVHMLLFSPWLAFLHSSYSIIRLIGGHIFFIY